MKTSGLFILLFLSTILQAQKTITKESLLNNKDITWVGEYEVTIPFDLIQSEIKKISSLELHWINSERSYSNTEVYTDSFNKSLNLEKLNLLKLKEMDIHSTLGYLLLNSTTSKNVMAYNDTDLKKSLNENEKKELFIKLRDTAITINPDTYSEEYSIVANEIRNYDLSLCKVRLFVYYNNTNSCFNMVCSAIAPILDRLDGKGNFRKSEPLVWLPVYMLDSTLNYSNPNINYAVNSLVTLEISKAKELKSLEKATEAIDKLIQSIKKSPDKFDLNIWNLNYYEKGDIIEKKEKQLIDTKIDTVWVIDPFTYEEKFAVEKTEYSSKNVTNFRFEINWYFDRTEQKLYATNLSFAPLLNKYYEDGNLGTKPIWKLLSQNPWFYHKVCIGKIYRYQE